MIDGYLEKVYAGFLGMNIGIRLGAPLEQSFWNYERIREYYGTIHDYVRKYRHFAADDDVNGPVFFFRALEDSGKTELEVQAAAEAWLNYPREGTGFFWWGGYGISTEHTAFVNLKSGIPAPQSGSVDQNGKTMAEQIGGQIFIDTWGLTAPGQADKAAQRARIASSVSHDGEGLSGAAFISACIAQAFVMKDPIEIIHSALNCVPQNGEYAKVVRAVVNFYEDHPDDWRLCREYIENEWGYDRYPGSCHIIPNAALCVLSLCYGKGNFAKTIEIAVMCSWDTDCNAGNVGTILGVMTGIAGIPEKYRQPVNDEIVLSSISGYLNILDIPTYANYLASWGYRLQNQVVPEEICRRIYPGKILFDFSFPGSTHGFILHGANTVMMRHAPDSQSLELVLNQFRSSDEARIFYKPFWRQTDFDDDRYDPVFSPTVYPGQNVSFVLSYAAGCGNELSVTPYVKDSGTQEETLFESVTFAQNAETKIDFRIPQLSSAICGEVGLILNTSSEREPWQCGRLRIHHFSVDGSGVFTLSPDFSAIDFGNMIPFSQNHGVWGIIHNRYHVTAKEPAEAVTGNYYMRDTVVSGTIQIHSGQGALISLHVQGAQRGYYAGSYGEDTFAILEKKHGRFELLCSARFDFHKERDYAIVFQIKGSVLQASIDNTFTLSIENRNLTYGMVGFCLPASGEASFGQINVSFDL